MAITLPAVSSRISRSCIMRRSSSIPTSTGTSANAAASSSSVRTGILTLDQIDNVLHERVGRADDLGVGLITVLVLDQVRNLRGHIDRRRLERAGQHISPSARVWNALGRYG